MTIFLLRFLSIVLLGLIGFQDFKYRGVSWYLFPLLAVFLYALNPMFLPEQGVINVSFVLVIFALLTLWFSLRKGRLVNLLEQHIGMGDFLFLFCLSFYFSPGNFFLFYTLSLLVIVLSLLLYRWFSRALEMTVPLAGLQGMVLIGVLSTGWIMGVETGNADFISLLL